MGKRNPSGMLGGFLLLALVWAGMGRTLAAEAPVKLAIVAAGSEFASVADLLTVELSAQPQLQLLERSQIERIYREQQISAANRDYVKLGQLLGADGLLMLDSAETENESGALKPPGFATPAGQNPHALNIRLVAVNPGVVLAAERFIIASDKQSEWAIAYGKRLQPLLPKLGVLAKDAVPVSVVNLRSAVSSLEAPNLERQLQTLVVQRLSREPQLFVLERQKLQKVSEEKGLQPGETRFWNGAWLLEGVVDQHGYSKSIIALNVKLTPAKGGTPLQFEVGGSRTNLAEVINALAEKVVASLRITSPVQAWNAADEAARFYTEAKWAMSWEDFKQAQTSADAAWVLGKRDLDCATIRLKARNSQVPLVLPPGSGTYKYGRRLNFVNVDEPPDLWTCDAAREALDCYAELFQASSNGEASMLSRGAGWNDWQKTMWYSAGIETLETASRVLYHFHFNPTSQTANAEQLASLRVQTRRLAGMIFNDPAVRSGYFVGKRIANHDELAHTMKMSANIFASMVNGGAFWQERPEDALAMYRQLMESPVFCYIHEGFLKRDATRPRLAAWNDKDRKRLPQVWETFLAELNASKNLLWQMEAKALTASDSEDEALADKARQEWWSLVRSNRAELVGNNVELFYLGWGFEANAETEGMNREYWNKTIPAFKAASAFESQKTFLRENQPYEFAKFVDLFREKAYSQKQALELLPLIVTYKSNLLAKAQLAERPQNVRLESSARSVESFLQRHVEKIAHPEAQPASRSSGAPALAATPQPSRATKRLATLEEVSDTITNITLVEKFLEIPRKGLAEETLTSIQIRAHQLFSGKLLLDLELGRVIYSTGATGGWRSMRYVNAPAIALLDIASEQWRVIEYEETDTAQLNSFYHHSVFWRNSVYTSQGGKVRRYDESSKVWVDLGIPDVGNCGLFVVNERLYGVTQNLIFEILEGTAGLQILASTRRQPPISALDSEKLSTSGYALGTPALFGDSKGTLRVVTANKIYSHEGADWRAVCDLPLSPGIPQITAEGIQFVDGNWHTPPSVWRLPVVADRVEYCLGKSQPGDRLQPLWKLPAGFPLSPLPAVSRGTDLLVLMDHSKTHNIVDEQNHVITSTLILPQDGYHAALLNFSTNYATPQKLYLKFDDIGAVLPVLGSTKAGGNVPNTSSASWLCQANGNLYLGHEFSGIASAGGQGRELARTGIWVLSLAQLDREIERQKQVQDMWQAGQVAEAGQAAQRLLEKFDHNQDGKIEGSEKHAALADENFLAAHLEQVDPNRNGFLDAAELKYFDANADAILDPNEQSGIQHSQRLLATRWLRQSDFNGDGLLDRREFDDLMRSPLDPAARPMVVGWFPDDNHDTWIDVEEVQAFCEQLTFQGLQNRSMPGRPLAPHRMPGGGGAMDTAERFKTFVDDFWKNGGTNSVAPPYRPGFMPPKIAVPVQPK